MWIILQPSSGAYECTCQILSEYAADSQASEACAALIHLVFVSLMASNWQEYLDYLHSELALFVRKPVHEIEQYGLRLMRPG